VRNLTSHFFNCSPMAGKFWQAARYGIMPPQLPRCR
jgi:hypothetical protein